MGKKKVLAVPTYVRQWRKYRHLTQEKLAAKAGLTPPSISQLEKGLQGFTDKSLAKLAKGLDCAPADLLTHDPTRRDGFWPLCQAAELLEGEDRRRLYAILRAALEPIGGDESK